MSSFISVLAFRCRMTVRSATPKRVAMSRTDRPSRVSSATAWWRSATVSWWGCPAQARSTLTGSTSDRRRLDMAWGWGAAARPRRAAEASRQRVLAAATAVGQRQPYRVSYHQVSPWVPAGQAPSRFMAHRPVRRTGRAARSCRHLPGACQPRQVLGLAAAPPDVGAFGFGQPTPDAPLVVLEAVLAALGL